MIAGEIMLFSFAPIAFCFLLPALCFMLYALCYLYLKTTVYGFWSGAGGRIDGA